LILLRPISSAMIHSLDTKRMFCNNVTGCNNNHFDNKEVYSSIKTAINSLPDYDRDFDGFGFTTILHSFLTDNSRIELRPERNVQAINRAKRSITREDRWISCVRALVSALLHHREKNEVHKCVHRHFCT